MHMIAPIPSGSPKDLRRVIQILTEGQVGGKSIESRSTQLNPGKGILSNNFSREFRPLNKQNLAESRPQEIDNEGDTFNTLNFDDSGGKNYDEMKPKFIDVLDRDDDEYYQHLKALRKRRGFRGFSAVFPISALMGLGIPEFKDHMLRRAKPGKFEVEDGVVTNASFEKVIENAIISRAYENLPNHLPYNVGIELQEVVPYDDRIVVVATLTVSYFFSSTFPLKSL